jgi:hypothetical protein
VTGRALYRDVRQCACAECSSQCLGFCQGTAELENNGSFTPEPGLVCGASLALRTGYGTRCRSIF